MNQIELGVTQDREDDFVGFKVRMLGRFFADLISIGSLSHIIGLKSLHRVETGFSPTIFFKIRKQ